VEVLGAYLAGIPLLGSLGVPRRPSSPCRQPHIPFERGGGGFGGRGCALRVLHRPQSSPVEYNLKINRIQLVN
jgi:hypothetical protein